MPGHDPPAGAGPASPDAIPADGPYVDDYAAALAALLEELRAWAAAVDAASPSARVYAYKAWVDRHAGSIGDARFAGYVAPVTCYAGLSPPPPGWLIEGCRQHFDPLYSFPVADRFSLTGYVLDVLLGNLASGRLTVIGGEALARAREAKREVDRSRPPDDWSAPSVVQPGLLRLEGGNGSPAGSPDALAALLSKARGMAPAGSWLDAARRLLAGPQGAAAAARRWLSLLGSGGGAMPSNATHRLALIFQSYNAIAWNGVTTLGDARAAAAAELCGQHRIGYYPDGSSNLDTGADHPALLSDANHAVVRGCAWLLSCAAAPENAAALQRAAMACLVQAPSGSGRKYRSLKGLNSCLWSLGQMATPEAVAALGRIGLGVRDERLSKQIAAAMSEAAAKAGMTIEDLQEIAVPLHGLDEPGGCWIGLADGFTASLAILSSTRTELTVLRPDGKAAKSVPAAVRTDADSTAALKALKAAANELEQALPVHRLRLERTWLTGRTWTGAAFRERFLQHNVMAWFAARLIWTVTASGGGARTCIFQANGSGIGADGLLQPPLRDGDTVALWHPLDPAEPGAAGRWRDMLVRHGITQPIKQAHREVYPLTAAELATGDYSNRFAGHIIRQAQANALARLRGWSCRSRIAADVGNDEPTHLRIPAHGLAAEYWTEAAGGPEAEWTESLAYVFLRTDRVRFRLLRDSGDWRRDGGRGLMLERGAVALSTVPPVVFSEVMRDVDLFVGVASIGHDPAWTDAGAAQHPSNWRRGPADEYWHAFNTAELAESARTRHAFLAGLVPKLAIAGRLSLEERHLVVQGDLRRYRIHIGSGNITMEPDGRYLCILAGQGDGKRGGGPIVLPFEGDRLLSVILSKAAMLANDTAITDPTILGQLRS